MIEASAAGPARTLVYVAAATAGTIDIYEMDEATGALKPVSAFEAGKMVMPMAVSPDRTHLYAVIRAEPYRVLTLAIDRTAGGLTQQGVAVLPDNMAYISTDPSGKLLLAASYGGNKIAALSIGRDGLVSEDAGQVIPTGRNAHSIVSDRSGKYVFATNLGSNAVLQFILNAETGLLTANDPPQVATRAGFGPRHIVVSPDNKSIYVLTELTGHVIHYALDAVRGTLTEVESIASVPVDAGLSPGIAPTAPASSNFATPITAPVEDGKPRVWAADIGITPNGKFLYTTERTTSTIALLRVGEPDGRLTYVTNYPTEQQPRGIRIEPSGRFLVASGEKSDRLSVYAIDPTDGVLTPAGRYPVSAGANWIEIVAFP
ncbi:lactonase family protein [Rhizobium sp. P44RR-XXIV]|uniref:lactonase family protein n=1 Tax=Rhizobium sp. P44RR-XXIV TaxID=1921145 RepID=UPI000984F98F|nr:lactonase family protein [Rhizobium sp. P44RR-XXIV]TIX87106.1 lactonase family protein [Rhizobium sp. P44RR-XXIV]